MSIIDKIKNHFHQQYLNETQNRKIVRLTSGIITLILGITMIILLIHQQYFSVDARYARDNLHFLKSEVNGVDMEVYKKTPVIKEPLIRTLFLIQIYEATYIISLPETAKEISEIPEEEFKNPFNIMVLSANDEQINNIYEEIKYTAAVINMLRANTMSANIIEEWQQYQNKAHEILQSLLYEFLAMLFLSIFLLIYGIINIVSGIISLRIDSKPAAISLKGKADTEIQNMQTQQQTTVNTAQADAAQEKTVHIYNKNRKKNRKRMKNPSPQS